MPAVLPVIGSVIGAAAPFASSIVSGVTGGVGSNVRSNAVDNAVNALVQGGDQAIQTTQSAADKSITGVNAATGQANDLLRSLYGSEMAGISPYQKAGATGLNDLAIAMPDLTKGFDPTAAGLPAKFGYGAADFQADPGYQFALDQANKAIQRSAAARGGVLSGGTLKALSDNSVGMASQQYNNAYQRALDTYQHNYQNAFNTFEANQANRYSRLSGMAGIGERANALALNAGDVYGGRTSNNLMGAAEYDGTLGYTAGSRIGDIQMAQANARAKGYSLKGDIWGNQTNQWGNAINSTGLAGKGLNALGDWLKDRRGSGSEGGIHDSNGTYLGE